MNEIEVYCKAVEIVRIKTNNWRNNYPLQVANGTIKPPLYGKSLP